MTHDEEVILAHHSCYIPFSFLRCNTQIALLDIVRRYVDMQDVDLNSGTVLMASGDRWSIPKAAWNFIQNYVDNS
jgi:hypothetical protein